MDLFPEPAKDQMNPFLRFTWIKKAVALFNALINAKGVNGITVTVSENGITIDGSGVQAKAPETPAHEPFTFIAAVYTPGTDTITANKIAYDGAGGLTDEGIYDGS